MNTESEVLRPWSPIETVREDDTVSTFVWGRRYEFGRMPFPSRIDSAGRPLLDGPVRLSARIAGLEIEWTSAEVEMTSQTPARVTLRQKSSAAAIVLTATTAIEYDGMIRIDWDLQSRQAVRLESLIVDIPLKKQAASLFYYCPRRDRPGPGTGCGTGGLIPREGFRTTFSPYVWVGDEECGLAWFTESPRNWSDDWAENTIEILPSAEQVILRLRLITSPVSLGKGEQMESLAYTFGLQATPVKPKVSDCWDTRIFHVNQELAAFRDVRLKISPKLLDSFAASGVRTVCIHEHWTDIEGYFTTDYGEDLKRLVAACHERGMQVLLYFGFLISDLAPEWATMGAECVVHPDNKGCYTPYNYPPQPIQNAYTVCYNSRWQEVTVDGIADVITKYGVDGIYLDGTASPWGCRNQEHNCGYHKPDGTLGFTYPIFAVRELMKRLYALVIADNPAGQVNVHSSYYHMIPALAWATGYTDGEQFAWDEVEQRVISEGKNGERVAAQSAGLPLDRFRCEFMGHPLGVPADFLADIRGPFNDLSKAFSIALLHDVPVRIWMRYDFTLQKQLWKLRDDFACKEATWLPYWNNGECVQVKPEGAFCSLYNHPVNGVLAIVSNLSNQPADVTVDLRLQKLGLRDGIIGRYALSGEPIRMEEGRFTVSLKSLDWQIVWARPIAAS